MKKILDGTFLSNHLLSVSDFENISDGLKVKKFVKIKTLAGSLPAFLVSQLTKFSSQPFIIITEDPISAENISSDIQLADPNITYAKLFEITKSIISHSDTQSQHLGEILEGASKIINQDRFVAVGAYSIFDEKLPTPHLLNSSRMNINKGDEVNFEDFRTKLLLNGFEKKEYVEMRGDIAVRGGIIDIFPIDFDNPLRLEFWGNRIDSIREFNIISQRSILEKSSISLITDVFIKSAVDELKSTILEYVPRDSIFVFIGLNQYQSEIPYNFIKENFSVLEINSLGKSTLSIHTDSQPKFSGSVKNFTNYLTELITQGYDITIAADGNIHLNRIKELIESSISEFESPINTKFNEIEQIISWKNSSPTNGFIFADRRIAVFCEHEIFERRKVRTLPIKQQKTMSSIQLLNSLNPGDFVVHEDKGIAVFEGFKSVKLGTSLQDCVRLRFASEDILYVHLNYIHKIQKYSASENSKPILSKLGSAEWKRKKARTKKKLKDIARDLILLYAKRKREKGISYPADTIWQKEFEASFIYEDTIDQARATDDIKKDMEDVSPMDRLICGDVGFGKTEVAIRAAFKAVQAGKQVGVLVPTTILAQQHYMTFIDRLSAFPVNIDVISRFRSKTEQTKILERLEKGGIDIIIGTHRILSQDIKFKDLGLIIIDEEHRFGVGSKEKLRQMKANVDTLTLTATPIPRTLNFSLMGARDLSIIETPPRNRIPVYTEIIEDDLTKITDIIETEIARGGQVFYVNDKIEDIDKIHSDLQMLMPSIRFATIHGQMKPANIESIMEKFVQKKFDVLIATKIIESGIDIPNANTMLINRAQNFGLAELYQLRGRVGRSNVQAFCYLIVPSTRKMQPRALQRLQAIEEFTELGSGLKLALKDMEIRGAGNLLGPEQSGFIIEIGYELYNKILDEAVKELKIEEFDDLFHLQSSSEGISLLNEEIVIDIDSDAFIPANYILNETDRFHYYKSLYALRTGDELTKLIDEIKDKFGEIPKELHELIFVIKLRISAMNIGFDKISLRKNTLICFFPNKENTLFYEYAFQSIIEFIDEIPKSLLKQSNDSLTLDIQLIHREQAAEILWKLNKSIEFALADA